MTSSANTTNQDGEHDVKESNTVTTIHRIYRGNSDELVLRDPNNRRSFINKPAYAKLHRTFSAGNKRFSVDGLKGRYEDLARQNSQEAPKKDPVTPEDETKEKFTPASFGYPKTAKLVPPLIKPKPVVRKRLPKDVNSNVVKKAEVSDEEEVRSIVLQPTGSVDSVDRITKELSSFTMDGKPKEKKRGSFRKLFLGGLFGKEKKKKEDDRTNNKQKPGDNGVYSDNIRNESSFTRNSPARQTVPAKMEDPYARRPNEIRMQEYHERKIRELEMEYAQLHVNRFNSIRQNFNEDRTENYVIINKTKPTITDNINKYIDTSSSAESEPPARDTPPRAQETHQNITVVKPKAIPMNSERPLIATPKATIPINSERPLVATPKATIPINSERPLPNPFQNEAPRTIERNLNKSESKDYPDKAPISPKPEETYGTVFDNVEYVPRTTRVDSSPATSPRPLSLASTKLRLPPNREIYEPQPRVKSPIPTNKVSTDKIIATELLKNTRSPTPPKRTVEDLATKPPMSPKSPKKPEPHFDRIVTNAMVHAPQRSQTPNRPFNSLTSSRASTPVELRMSVSAKMSPKKEDVKRSVEEYYWKQLKKLKDEEDQKLYALQMNGYYEEQRLRRSRSLSPSQRIGRSLSLPRNQNYVEYGRMRPQQAIPEDQAVTVTDGQRHFVYDQNFVRNNPERRSVDNSMQRPIFRRGSLTKQEMYDSSPYNKRVSFSSSQYAQAWPTRNGYTPTPPQRRIERQESDLDDDVFVPPEAIYGTKYVQKEPFYSNRVLDQFRAQQYDQSQQQVYGYAPQMGDRRLSMDSLPKQDIYGTRAVRRISQYDDHGRTNVQRYPSNSQLPLQRQPIYCSRQSMTDSNYGKQVTVKNKICDIYGQIHDAPTSGIVMGQLQNSPMVPQRQPASFVRGSRLTASANDIGNRNGNQIYDKYKVTSYENRPLPPLPRQAKRHPQISDTESGSDISEVQRVMNTKSKKRNGFGK